MHIVYIYFNLYNMSYICMIICFAWDNILYYIVCAYRI